MPFTYTLVVRVQDDADSNEPPNVTEARDYLIGAIEVGDNHGRIGIMEVHDERMTDDVDEVTPGQLTMDEAEYQRGRNDAAMAQQAGPPGSPEREAAYLAMEAQWSREGFDG